MPSIRLIAKAAMSVALLCALVVGVAPARATSSTTVTSASCDLETRAVTLHWTGKTPFSYRVVIETIGPAGLADDYFDKGLKRSGTWTFEIQGPWPLISVRVWLYGKPQGNIVPSFPHNGPELYDAVLPCT